MSLDMLTLQVVVAVVVFTTGIIFITETILRRDRGAGRIWSLGFLSAMLTVVSYMLWMTMPDPWVANAMGNTSMFAATACMWLGIRCYNDKPLAMWAWICLFLGALVFGGTLLSGPWGGDWAGALFTFPIIAFASAMAAIESRRGEMGKSLLSIGFTVVLAIEALFYAIRLIVFVTLGPESAVFQTWFGSAAVALLTIVLLIVAIVVLSVLRTRALATLAEMDPGRVVFYENDVLKLASFENILRVIAKRAEASNDLIAVVAMKMEDLPQIGIAFGLPEEAALAATWRRGVRQHAPNFSLVGIYDATGIVVAFQPSSVGDARRIASRIHRRLLDDFAEMESAVIPVIGVGVSLSETSGYDTEVLIERACEAAKASSTSSDASVIIAGI